MNLEDLSRLVPEVTVLLVVGYFFFKVFAIFKEIIEKVDDEHHDALTILAKSIDKNTKVSEENVKTLQSIDTYTRERNGRDNEQHSKNIAMQNKLLEQMEQIPAIYYSTEKRRSEEAKELLDAVKDSSQSVQEQNVEHQTVTKQDIE